MNVNELIKIFETNISKNNNNKNNNIKNFDINEFKTIKRENVNKIKEIENKLYNQNNSKNRRRHFTLNDEEKKNDIKILINSTKSIINDILIDKKKIKNSDLNNELLNVIKLYKYYINEDDVIKILINEHIINYLIDILNNETFFIESNQNLSFDYLEKIVTKNSESYDFLLTNENFISFLLKNFKTIIEIFKNNKENYNNLSKFEIIKFKGILNMLIILSKEKKICDKIDINDLIFILTNQKSMEKSIIANFLEIIKNFLILNNNHKIFYEVNFIDLLLNLFKLNNNDIDIIKNIINIIHDNINNEKFILNLINKNLLQYLISIFSQNKNDNQKRNSQNFIINLLLIIDLVDKNKKFCKDFMNKNNIIEIIEQLEENLFNSKIVEITLNLINKCSKKNCSDLNNLFFSEMNELFIKILNKYIGTCQNNIIKETLELIFISCSNKTNLLFYSEKCLDILVKLYQTYLDNEDIIFEILQILNIIYENESISIENIDFDSLIFNISEIFQKYIHNNKLIHILSSFLFNLAKKNIETFNIFNLILNNCLYFIEEANVDINEYQEILDTLFNIISIEKNIEDINKYILFLIEKIFPKLLDLKISLNLLQKILSILYLFITKSSLNELNVNKENIFKLLCKLNKKKIFDGFTFTTFSKIIKYLCSKYDEVDAEKISKENFYFIYESLNNLLDNINEIYFQDILEDLKIISLFYRINKNENINFLKNIYDISFKIFDKIIKENNVDNLKIFIDIIKNICNKNILIKNEFNQNERNIIEEIKIYLLQNEKNEDLKTNKLLIEYNLKSCEMILYSNDISESEVNYQKINLDNNKNLNSEIFHSMSSTESEINENDISLDKEKFDFLSMENNINYYTLKQDYKNIFLKFDDDLRFFSVYTKNNNNMINVLDELSIDNIDSCVRSCSDEAFKMKKVHIFKKKPNALKCFIILEKKNVNKKQKTYCFECSDEITCIKYVDCISELIEKNKKAKNIIN